MKTLKLVRSLYGKVGELVSVVVCKY